MKVWIKLLIGAALGITIGFLLPDNQGMISVLQWLEKFALGIGRYAVIPVLVFSLTIGIYELRADEQFWPMVFKNFLVIIAVSVFVIFAGITVTMVFSPSRIPIETVEQLEILNFKPLDDILEIFPSNMFSVLAGDGVFLFPVCIFAFFLGMGLNYDKTYSKPVISLLDSFSRIFYHVASFFCEIMGFIIIVLSAYWAVRFNNIIQVKVYTDLVIMLAVFSVVLCFGVIPLLLYFLRPKVNPWLVLYGYLGPALTAFFSGDINMSIPVLQRHSKENFGIRRRSCSLSIALFSTFCRCGSAMVAAAAFIIIIKSYSYLKISTIDLFTIGLQAFLISFILARHPGDGAYIALAALCLTYGGGEYRAGYLILKPLAFYLVAVGTFIDIMLNAFGSYVLARTNGFIEEKNIVHFI
ncbi:MAG: cation:dicarboxylase symporter family transporter [Treponema sp.]|nr:cation:dicarboxylase symporter family transporter [Treponema sp.]MCL2271532.1 cation:dicarboxylase symporter family transporter [Treponema sp.]